MILRRGKLPFVSVVVPAHNEESFLPLCLSSLQQQDYTGNYEIIVVDNASTDGTAEIATSFGARVVYEAKQSPAWARQRGLLAAKGEIVAFIDADTIAPKNWLASLIQHLRHRPEAIAVGGPCTYFDLRAPARVIVRSLLFLTFLLDHTIRRLTGKGGALWASNFATWREKLLGVGGFNTKMKFFGEDVELPLRLRKKGKVSIIPTLFVLTSARRFKEIGIWCGLWNYVINYFSALFFHKPLSHRLENLPRRFSHAIGDKLYPVLGYPTGAKYIVVFSLVFGFLFWIDKKYLLIWDLKLAYFIVITVGILGFAYFRMMPFHRLYGRVMAHGDRHQRRIALTFDDGPNEPFTSQILDVLAKYNVKATFFVVGHNVERCPAICSRVAKSGHVVGNHSYFHSRFFAFKRDRDITQELQLTQEIIYRASGVKPNLFRPPYGLRTPWLSRAAEKLGLAVITWDNMTNDWDPTRRAEEITKGVLSRVKPGSIILLHDGRDLRQNYNRTSLLEALPQILTKLKEQGYQFVTIPELLGNALDTSTFA